LADEKAGEQIATEEIKEGGWDATENTTFNENAEAVKLGDDAAPADAAAEDAEPEDNSKSYADYLAEKAAKKLEGLGLKEARAPNEGSKENKQWSSAKEFSRQNQDEAYFVGEEKARRERERVQKKNVIDIDYSFKEPPRESGGRGRGRGDREGGRGGRGRGDREGGERRGDFGGRGRGDREGRGRGRGRGDRGGDRGDFGGRGGRGGARRDESGPAVAVNDESAFPSLGGK